MKEFEIFGEVKLATEPGSNLGQTRVRPRFIASLNPGLYIYYIYIYLSGKNSNHANCK